MTAELHRILRRQLRRSGASRDEVPKDLAAWHQLLDRINVSYRSAEQDRYTLKRAMDLSSHEMDHLNQDLAIRHEQLAGLVGALSHATIRCSPAWRIELVNDAASTLLGGTVDGLVGERLPDHLLVTVDGIKICAPSLRPKAGRPFQSNSAIVVAGTKGPFPASVTVNGIWKRGECLGYVVVLQDLTDLRHAEHEAREAKIQAVAARQAEQSKAQFLANMSHELRTPLNAIIGFGQLLVEDLDELTEDEMADDARRILKAGNHLLTLINQLLDLTKIDAGRMQVELKAFPLERLLGDVASMAGPLCGTNANTFCMNNALGNPTIVSDEFRLRQCLFNLVGNAAKFTSDGVIELRVDGSDDELIIAVKDTGVGMTSAQCARVFAEFAQADLSTTRRFGGSGLGLPITRAIAHLLGGDLTVESEPGFGSIFWLRLPTARLEPAN